MKTPQQIAEDAARAVLLANIDNLRIWNPDESPLASFGWALGEGIEYEDGLMQLVVTAIEADRAQRSTAPEDDGTIHAAVIAALWDRAASSESGEQSKAASGAYWVETAPDEFWEEFAGPMLDDIERKLS